MAKAPKDYTVKEVQHIIKASMGLFTSLHTFSFDIGERIQEIYRENGQGILVFNAEEFGATLLDPKKQDQPIDVMDLLSRNARYINAKNGAAFLDTFDKLPDLKGYNPTCQYPIGVFLALEYPQKNRGFRVYNAATLAPIFTKKHRASRMYLN